jgi:hypothetical protein
MIVYDNNQRSAGKSLMTEPEFFSLAGPISDGSQKTNTEEFQSSGGLKEVACINQD